MSDSVYYKISYTIKYKKEDFEADDVYTLYHIRCPYVKTSSFAFLTIPLEFYRAKAIQEQIESSTSYADFLTIEIEYSLVDHNQPEGRNYKKIETLCRKIYSVLNIQFLDKDALSARLDSNLSITCRLVLVNPILYFMQNVNMFNTKFINKKPIDIIYGFSDYLKNTFKDSFNSKILHLESNINDHIYEQMVVRAKNDLLVPKQSNDMYKIYKYPSYFFFDDFTLPNEKEVTFYSICLGNPSLFNKIDIYERNGPTAYYGTQLTKKTPIVDINGIFNSNRNQTKIAIRNSEGFHKIIEPKESKTLIPATQLMQDQPPNDNSNSKTSQKYTPVNLEINKFASSFKLYTPDNFDNGLDRFFRTSDFFKLRVLGVYEFRSAYVKHDYYQFTNIYNLDISARNEFSFLPISICNIFYKLDYKSTACVHSAKICTLKYNLG